MNNQSATFKIKKSIYRKLQNEGWALENRQKFCLGFINSPIIFFPQLTSNAAFEGSNEMTFHMIVSEDEALPKGYVNFNQQVYIQEFPKKHSLLEKFKINHFLKRIYKAKTQRAIYEICFLALNNHIEFFDKAVRNILQAILTETNDRCFCSLNDNLIKTIVANEG